MTNAERFERHLQHASEVVATWPEWKQKLLGGEAMSEPATKPDLLRVTVDKYTVVQDASGRLFALRNGELWRDCVGDNLILQLAYEVDELRQQIQRAKDTKQ